MNRIDTLFREKQNNILSIYFTAGHPTFESTVEIIKELQNNGVDLIEIGMPFSDPLADGPVIQKSSQVALNNGMSIRKLFAQLKEIRETINIPLILFGYLNPVLQYGFEKFCQDASEIGIDGLILPDLPPKEYMEHYKNIVEKYNLKFIFLISPETSNERVEILDSTGSGFNYIVSSSSTTGAKEKIIEQQKAYFERINSLNLKLPKLIGFGISNNESYLNACKQANGVIIGSAFVNAIDEAKDLKSTIKDFVNMIRG
ncbi:tryptophan synthase subunit alpha [Bacteroidota bacterium]